MHRSRAPSIAPGTFFVAQPLADCITNMPGFNLRQAQARRRDKGQIGNLSRQLLKEYPPMLLCEPSLSSLVALAVAEALTIGAPDAEVELLDVLVLAQGFGVAIHHYAAVFQNIAVSRKS
jgi:hypothetical protein